MNRRARSLALAAALALGCGDDGEAALARVTVTRGSVERAASVRAAWAGAAVGDELRRGGGLRTGVASEARVKLLRGGGELRLGELSMIWLGSEAGELGVEVATGAAEIEAGGFEIALSFGGASARLERNATARVEQRDGAWSVEVLVGSAVIEQAGEPARPLAAGERLTLGRGAGPIARTAPDAGAAVVEPRPAAPDAGPGGGGTIELPGGEIALRKPVHAELALPAGETATLHTDAPPVAVGISVAQACPNGARVEVAGRRGGFERPSDSADGAGVVSFELAAGTHRYRVRCAEAGGSFAATAAVEGTLVIERDKGRKRVSAKPPHNAVDADGRKYTVLYQGVLPSIELRWSRAPRADGYVLSIRDEAGQTRELPAAGPEHTLASGELAEGSYLWWFTATGADRASPRTKLRVDFDNAAPTAYISAPGVAEAWSGDGVDVAGTAMRGASVTVNGQAVDLDRHWRFSTRTSPDERDAIAIRIAHPKRGVHYYVRRRASP